VQQVTTIPPPKKNSTTKIQKFTILPSSPKISALRPWIRSTFHVLITNMTVC